ncbi:MAG: response regulator [Candidatus Brocadia sp.]
MDCLKMIKKILIIDDSPVARKILKSCIPKDLGYEIREANDGSMGVKMFKEENPDITFMDVTMPVMDGIQALEAIKKIDNNAIVIMCTADVQMQSVSKAMSFGALTLIKKPPTKEAIQEALLKAQDSLQI